MTRKEQIIKVALELFSKRGYQGTSTSLIAKESNVSEGLIFRHYGSKEGLLKAVLEIGVEDVLRSLEPLRRKDKGLENLIEYLHRFSELLSKNRDYWRLVSVLRFQHDVQQLMKELFFSVNQIILSSFGETFKTLGEKKKDQKALLLYATLDGIALHYTLFSNEYPLAEIIEKLENELITHYTRS